MMKIFLEETMLRDFCKRSILTIVVLVVGLSGLNTAAYAQDITQKLAGFDEFMAKTLKDWNAPGIGVGIVVGDKLVFAKGYGYRDYEKKLPVTPQTMFTIAPNTNLFTTVAPALLAEKRKL